MDRCVLGQDGNTALALEVGVVHDPIHNLLVLAVDAALLQQRVDQRGFSVVDVRDDRHIASEGIGDLVEAEANLAPELRRTLAPDGRLVAAGILQERRGQVVDAFAAAGLAFVEEHHDDDWVTFVCAAEAEEA